MEAKKREGRGIRLDHRFGFYLKPRPPFDFELTVHKPAGWSLFTTSEIFENRTLWTALHINGALTGLKLRSNGTTEKPLLKADVFLRYPAGSEQKKEIRRTLIEKLTADEDLTAFYALAKKDPILKHTIDGLYGMHGTNPGTLFADATLAILLQMAPLKRSEEMMECVIRSYGDLAEFDGKKVYTWPTPEKIARLSVQKLSKCKLGYRAKRLLKLARVLETGYFPTLEQLGRLTPEEAKTRLLELPGIGDYSADILNPHGGFPIDAWSADVFGKLFYGKEPEEGRNAIDRIKAEGTRRWGRYSWMAFMYVVQDLEGLSRKIGTSLRLQ